MTVANAKNVDLCVTVLMQPVPVFCFVLFFFLKKSIQSLIFLEIRLGLEGYIHIYAFSGFFLT